jgi:predicted O-methyltransferase YrrM
MEYLPKYIVNPQIEEYLSGLIPVDDIILREMEELGKERNFPIIGPLVGRLLYLITLAIKARRVFEMGSGFGYSSYWFAKAVGEGGNVIFSELSENNAQLAQDFFRRGELEGRIKINVGNSIEILDEIKGEFDIIFNDIEKEQYPFVVEKAYKRLRKGGLLITDNVLWFGRILTDDDSPSTQGVREFTRMLLSEKGFITTIIPIRDGVSISLKL